MNKRQFKKTYAPTKAAKENLEYGVFKWRGDGKYNRSDAVKIYKSKAAAEKQAEKFANNHVVRTLR